MWEVRIIEANSRVQLQESAAQLCLNGWEPVSYCEAVAGAYQNFSMMLRRQKVVK